MEDGVELPEGREIHEEYRYTLPVSLTISILAVLVGAVGVVMALTGFLLK